MSNFIPKRSGRSLVFMLIGEGGEKRKFPQKLRIQLWQITPKILVFDILFLQLSETRLIFS